MASMVSLLTSAARPAPAKPSVPAAKAAKARNRMIGVFMALAPKSVWIFHVAIPVLAAGLDPGSGRLTRRLIVYTALAAEASPSESIVRKSPTCHQVPVGMSLYPWRCATMAVARLHPLSQGIGHAG